MGTCRAPNMMLLTLKGAVQREDLPMLVEGIRAHLRQSPAERVVCDVEHLAVDIVTVDALARLRLAARRRGREVSLLNASDELHALLELVGLDETIPPCDVSGIEMRRQVEQREELLGVQEESDTGDPTVL